MGHQQAAVERFTEVCKTVAREMNCVPTGQLLWNCLLRSASLLKELPVPSAGKASSALVNSAPGLGRLLALIGYDSLIASNVSFEACLATGRAALKESAFGA